MKKIMILVVVFSFVLIGSLSAQELGFGAKGGLNLGTYVGKDVEDANFRTGLSIGGFVTLQLNEMFTIRPEILITQNGATNKYELYGYKVTSKQRLNWLDIPVLAVVNVLPNIKVFAGPYIDLFLNGKNVVKILEESESKKVDRDEMTAVALGVVLGGSFGITDNIDVELRLTNGLNSLAKEAEDADYKPFMFQFLCNYHLK